MKIIRCDLFDNTKTIEERVAATRQKTLFDDYEGFVEKFKPKKTTDDCYTPTNVYDAIVAYVKQAAGLPDGVRIARPFYPGNDYTDAKHYHDCDVVIDNPPFSIISKIVGFYEDLKIPYFLFAPYLTLFGIRKATNLIVSDEVIKYENGALVPTSFVSNLFGDKKIIGDAELVKIIRETNKTEAVALPKYEYPPNLLTVSKIAYCADKGVSVSFDADDVYLVRELDSQKRMGKSIFGAGFLLSEKAAAEKAAAEKAAAEKANVIVWELSEREKEIIHDLSKTKQEAA